jgi:hypothetical protein
MTVTLLDELQTSPPPPKKKMKKKNEKMKMKKELWRWLHIELNGKLS